MASDGLTNIAKNGTCRICQRVRNTSNQVKAVGEVRHGFAVGHIWECIDTADCDQIAQKKINEKRYRYRHIELAIKIGRFSEYKYFS